jgi:putative hydrolase of HD superfamily
LQDRPTDFIFGLGKLKTIPRSGWISHGIGPQEVESVADHAFSTSGLAMFLADMEGRHGRHVDVEKVLRMALLHDLAEGLTFDISKSYLEYLGRRGEAIKREVEEAAWNHIVESIRGKWMRMKYAELQSEFNAEETFESQIVHAADKLDILFQVIAYHRKGYPRRILADLWTSTNRSLTGVRIPSVSNLRKTAVRLYKAAT